MRKLFLSIVAAAALITSCSKDDTTSAPINQRSKVTFAVNAPELATRAGEGEGLQAKNLEYVIYDLAEDTSVEANLITGKTTFPAGELTTTVEVDLVEGRTYEAIFFATADNAPYTFNKTKQTMTINTEKLMANQESYDAFYKYVEPFTIEATAKEMDVEMTRPFAQLNVATDDFDKDGGKLIDAKTTGIEVTAYTTLDFKSGDVDGKKTIVYGLSNKMDGTIKANTKDYDWLTMNYLLVNARELVDVKFVFTDEPNNLAENPLTRNYGSVPVERNYRTNIVGSILTNKTEFNVTILPGFETPDEIYDVDKTKEVVVNSAQELQAAINAANAENDVNIIKLGKNITTDTTRALATPITIPQTEGVNIVIDGDGHIYNGTIYIDGNSRSNGAETLTFRNINFKHSNGNIDFISANNQAEVERYAHNVTVENCTFSHSGAGTAVGMRFRQAYNINVLNCTVPAKVDKTDNNMFLLMWATGGNGITVDGANITVGASGEGGLSFGTSTDIVVKNSTITNNNNTEYGVRVADSITGNNIKITFENNTITANYPVIARYMDTHIKDGATVGQDNVDMTFNGVNTLTATNANGYQVVFTKNNSNAELADCAEGTTINLTGADDFNVFPRDVAIATAAELKAFRDAVNAGNTYAGKVVKLVADINLNGEEWTPIGIYDLTYVKPENGLATSYVNNFNGTFDGNGHTISNFKVTEQKYCAGLFGTMSGGATIKNLTVSNATLTSNHYAGGIVAWAEAGASSLTIENCHVKNATITVTPEEINGSWDNGDKAGGIIGWIYKNSIIGCSVENTTIKAYRDVGGIVGYVKGGTVKNNAVKSGVTLIQNNDHNYKNYTSEAAVNFGDIIGRRDQSEGAAITEGGNSGSATKLGGIFDGIYEVDGEWNIITLKGLKQFAANVNSGTNYKNKTVKLVADIDLNNEDWTPIGTKNKYFQGTFVGNNHTISNLYINDLNLENAGLFGYTKDTKISGVKVKNVNIRAYYAVGSIVGTAYTGKIEDCHVSGTINLYADYAYAGGITSNGYITVTNCSVIADDMGVITVRELTMAGGITGWRGEGKNNITNCTVKNLNITANSGVGAISGLVHYNNTIDNCTAENIKLTKTRMDGQASIGLAAGIWAAKADNKYTIIVTNNSFKNISLNGSALKSKDGVDISSFLQDGQRLIGSNYSKYINIPEDKLVVENNSYENISDNLTFVE